MTKKLRHGSEDAAHRLGRRMRHGTNACYVSGCRLPACREAHSRYQYFYRRTKQRRLTFDKSSDGSIPHGTRTGYCEHGCRCALCVEAQREYMRAYRRKVSA